MESLQTQVVPTRHLLPPLADARHERVPEFIHRLADNLKERGQRQPILCLQEGSAYRVLAGESRRQALIVAGIEHAMVAILNRPLNDGEQLMEQFTENEFRCALTPLERAEMLQKLRVVNGWTLEQLAATVGLTPGAISKLLALPTLPEDIQRLVAEGKIPMTVGSSLARLTDVALMRSLTQGYLEGKLTRDAIANRVRNVRAQPSPKGNKPVKIKTKAHIEIALPWADPQQLIDSLAQVVEALKQMNKLSLDMHSLPSLLRRVNS